MWDAALHGSRAGWEVAIRQGKLIYNRRESIYGRAGCLCSSCCVAITLSMTQPTPRLLFFKKWRPPYNTSLVPSKRSVDLDWREICFRNYVPLQPLVGIMRVAHCSILGSLVLSLTLSPSPFKRNFQEWSRSRPSKKCWKLSFSWVLCSHLARKQWMKLIWKG